MSKPLDYEAASETLTLESRPLLELLARIEYVSNVIQTVVRKKNGNHYVYENPQANYLPERYRWATHGGAIKILSIGEKEVIIARLPRFKTPYVEFAVPREELHKSDWQLGKEVRAEILELKNWRVNRLLVNSHKRKIELEWKVREAEAQLSGMKNHIDHLTRVKYSEIRSGKKKKVMKNEQA